MKDKTWIIKIALMAAGFICLTIAILSMIFSFFTKVLGGLPLPNTFIFFQGFVITLLGFGALYAIDKIAEKIESVFGVEIIKKIILTIVLVGAVYVPLFYAYYWYIPTLVSPYFALLESRWVILFFGLISIPVVGSCYYLVQPIWPVIGKIKWGLALSAIVVVIVLSVNLYQQPIKLFDRTKGSSIVWYHSIDFTPYFYHTAKKGDKIYDERDGSQLVQLTQTTDKKTLRKIKANLPNLKYFLSLGWIKPAQASVRPAKPKLTNYKIYQPKDYQLNYTKGQITDHWIRPIQTKAGRVNFMSDNKQFEIITRDGKTIRIWAGEKPPQHISDFKIRAIENTFVLLRFT